MKFEQIRNATIVLEYADKILIPADGKIYHF